MSQEIYKAIIKVGGEIGPVTKSKINPAFKSAYAPLDEILGAVKPVLAKYGLAVLFRQVATDNPDFVSVETVLIHESGESLGGIFTAKPMKLDPQGTVGAITYLKRCGITALLALELDDDDDGNSVSSVSAPAQSRVVSAPAGAPTAPRQAPAKPAPTAGGFEI
jgi:hypothetical protein